MIHCVGLAADVDDPDTSRSSIRCDVEPDSTTCISVLSRSDANPRHLTRRCPPATSQRRDRDRQRSACEPDGVARTAERIRARRCRLSHRECLRPDHDRSGSRGRNRVRRDCVGNRCFTLSAALTGDRHPRRRRRDRPGAVTSGCDFHGAGAAARGKRLRRARSADLALGIGRRAGHRGLCGVAGCGSCGEDDEKGEFTNLTHQLVLNAAIRKPLAIGKTFPSRYNPGRA